MSLARVSSTGWTGLTGWTRTRLVECARCLALATGDVPGASLAVIVERRCFAPFMSPLRFGWWSGARWVDGDEKSCGSAVVHLT